MLVYKLRLQKGWSQEQLADLSGLSVRTIQRIENGQAASVESLKSLASVFEVDFNTLKEPTMNSIPNDSTPSSSNAQGISNEEMNLFTENSKGLGLKSLKARIILLKANINYNKDINSSSITLTVPLNPNKLV